jgi:hypothetical protein
VFILIYSNAKSVDLGYMGVLYGVFAWFCVRRVSLSEPLGNSFAAAAVALGLCNGANIAATCHQPPKHVSHSKSSRATAKERRECQSSIYFFCRPTPLTQRAVSLFCSSLFLRGRLRLSISGAIFSFAPPFALDALYMYYAVRSFRCIYDFGK